MYMKIGRVINGILEQVTKENLTIVLSSKTLEITESTIGAVKLSEND